MFNQIKSVPKSNPDILASLPKIGIFFVEKTRKAIVVFPLLTIALPKVTQLAICHEYWHLVACTIKNHFIK
jgi:hypothetical protein